MADENQTDLTALTVQLLSAFVSNNTVASDSLADLIKSTRTALTESSASPVEEPTAPTFTPAVSVRKSLSSPDHIISLIDGKPYKTLKRHLTVNDLTPEQYRARYNLPKNYPLVAPSYSDSRRAVAEKIGLGKKPAVASIAAKPAEAAAAPVAAPKAKAAVTPKAPKKATAASAQKAAEAKAAPAAKATPTAAAEAPKAALTKPAVAPAKKDAKAKDVAAPKAASVISNGATTASAAPAVAKKEPRKRLSIAGPKADAKVETAPAPAPAKAKPVAKKADVAPKAKSASKPKSVKAATEAAPSDVSADGKTPEVANAQS